MLNAEDAKAMGCEDLEDQLLLSKSQAHVYGHSKCRTVEEHGRIIPTGPSGVDSIRVAYSPPKKNI